MFKIWRGENVAPRGEKGIDRGLVRVTRPGGWIQMAEIYFNCQSDNNTLTLDHALRQWSAKYLASVDDIKDPRIPMRMRDLMIGAGLADVDQTMIPLPLCGWSTSTSVLAWNGVLDVSCPFVSAT